MDNAKIVVDAGHGGNDPGAIGNGIIEKEYSLLISNYIFNRLQELGIPAKMTRTTDETISPTERVKRVLNAFGNSRNVIVVSNHLNAGGGDGAEIIYALRNTDTLSRIILEELAKEGQNIRKYYQRRLPSDTSKDYYFMQRDTGVTQPITVEYGFVDNATDANRIKSNWKRYAEAVVRGLVIYIKANYVAPPGANVYIVKSGDTLYSIAKKYNTTTTILRTLNNLTSDTLKIGQIINLPTTGTPPPTPPPTANTYIVRSGDTLYSIANKFNTTVTALKALNNLTTNTLTIGQILNLPTTGTPPPTTSTYTVRSGDTLYSIANRFNTTVTTLKALNNLTTNTLTIGQILNLPTTGTTPPPTTSTYTVKSGDTLYTIANRYNTTVDTIKNLNNLTTNTLTIGQVLLLPTSATDAITYTVKSGDNLYSIADKYNTTVTEIKTLNNLSSNLLSIGQVLKIPSTRMAEIRNSFVVNSGDTLWNVAKRFNTTAKELKTLNNLTTNALSIGQSLTLE